MSTRRGREPELEQACSPSHFSSARNGSPGLGGLGWGPLPFPGEKVGNTHRLLTRKVPATGTRPEEEKKLETVRGS